MCTFSTSERQKRLQTLSFWHFWLLNVLRATTACSFSTGRPKVARTRPAAFSEPTFRPSGATNHWKKSVNRDFPTFSRTCIFFLLSLSLLWSSHFFSSPPWLFTPLLFHLSILSEVWLLNLVDEDKWFVIYFDYEYGLSRSVAASIQEISWNFELAGRYTWSGSDWEPLIIYDHFSFVRLKNNWNIMSSSCFPIFIHYSLLHSVVLYSLETWSATSTPSRLLAWQVNGAQELRPKKLLVAYLSSWVWRKVFEVKSWGGSPKKTIAWALLFLDLIFEMGWNLQVAKISLAFLCCNCTSPRAWLWDFLFPQGEALDMCVTHIRSEHPLMCWKEFWAQKFDHMHENHIEILKKIPNILV